MGEVLDDDKNSLWRTVHLPLLVQVPELVREVFSIEALPCGW